MRRQKVNTRIELYTSFLNAKWCMGDDFSFNKLDWGYNCKKEIGQEAYSPP